eukprot:SM009743S25166  [mRNA]  locus=s9743:130:543:+ [translate_table: standard]
MDVAPSATAYVHRVGRTGRAGSAGTAITLVSADEEAQLASLSGAMADGRGDPWELPDWPVAMAKAVEGLRYRAEDVLRSVTPA